jgi:hypothetical protein
VRNSSCPSAPAVDELRQGKQTGADERENQPGDACGDDRHDAVPREFFHEQISENWASFTTTAALKSTVHCCRTARRAAHRDLNVRILRTRGHMDMTADRFMWHVRNLICGVRLRKSLWPRIGDSQADLARRGEDIR